MTSRTETFNSVFCLTRIDSTSITVIDITVLHVILTSSITASNGMKITHVTSRSVSFIVKQASN